MESFARVGMLVEMGAVEARQAMRVVREMPGYPVDEDADAACS
jgi:hypothetical protein